MGLIDEVTEAKGHGRLELSRALTALVYQITEEHEYLRNVHLTSA